jgi:hypothetical protein
MDEPPDLSALPLDDQFMILLHKKIMDKKGSARRRAKKYYTDQYKKTGIIPRPLLLAGQGIMEGRKCSGRPPALSAEVKRRFIQMVKASCDAQDPSFIYITRRARKITTYHVFLQDEFRTDISIHALRRLVRKEGLDLYLKQPDFDQDPVSSGYFNPEQVFDLIQVDGCKFQYLKIRAHDGAWRKPQVIEFYDTGSRYMFVLECYFTETSLNAVDLFSRFLLDAPVPNKKIRLRPDRAKAFVNLKRPIHELNIKYSVPGGFYMDPDFSGRQSPKHKVHLESSHRSLHDFEIRVIKRFEDRIVKTEPGFVFKGSRKEQIVVTCLDIGIEQLRQSGMIELYRREHNERSHRFSEGGRTQAWIPSQRLHAYLSGQQTMVFDPAHMDSFLKYGFDKHKATVSKDKTIVSNRQKYTVVVGADKFSSYTSTPVKISHYNNKLYVFENKDDGICLGEAVCQKPSQMPESVTQKAEQRLKRNEVEQICGYLEDRQMSVNIRSLISCYQNGLTFGIAEAIFEANMARYQKLAAKLQDPTRAGFVRFNAFLIDVDRHRQRHADLLYAKEYDDDV